MLYVDGVLIFIIMNKEETILKIFKLHPKISTDSRVIEPNCLFFALKGDNFDGNLFALKALEKGAAYAIVDDVNLKDNDRVILVENVLLSLQQLASNYRKDLKADFIGITGTNGKTTTKELINIVLQKQFKTYSTKGNFNNHIGVPLTILSINKDCEKAIIEMGANHIGEIEELCNIAQPNYGIITNIGKAHLEGFKNIEGVIETKKALYYSVNKNNGIIFCNKENILLNTLCKGIKNVSYGNHIDSDFTINMIAEIPFVKVKWLDKNKEYIANTNLTGGYNYENIAAAICIGKYFGVSDHNIIVALESYIPSNNRSQFIKTKENDIIVDCYNANPSSMKAALESFSSFSSSEKTVILGDMFELGTESKTEHYEIIKLLNEYNFKNVILSGDVFFELAQNESFFAFKTTEETILFLKNNKIHSNTILLKGSRKMHLESLIEFL